MLFRQPAFGYQKRLIILAVILGISLVMLIGCSTQDSKPVVTTDTTTITTDTINMKDLESYLVDLGIDLPISCPPLPESECVEFATIAISLYVDGFVEEHKRSLVEAGIDPWYTSPVCHSMGKYLKAGFDLDMSQSARDVLINAAYLVESYKDVAYLDFLVITDRVDFPMVRFANDRECIMSIDPQFFAAR